MSAHHHHLPNQTAHLLHCGVLEHEPSCITNGPHCRLGGFSVGCLLYVSAICRCISGTDLLIQAHTLPHWDRNCTSNFLSHPITVYCHWLLAGCLTSQQQACVSQRRICSDDCTCRHSEIKLQIKLSILPSHSILTPGQPVPALTLCQQAPGRVATGISTHKWRVWLHPETSPWWKRELNLGQPLSRRAP